MKQELAEIQEGVRAAVVAGEQAMCAGKATGARQTGPALPLIGDFPLDRLTFWVFSSLLYKVRITVPASQGSERL